MSIQRNQLRALGIAAVMACAIPTFAQELQVFVQDDFDPALGVEAEPQDSFENRYRIGIDCSPASEALKSHLHLSENSGLLVNSVLGSSAAGRAGVKRFDVIVEANGDPVATAYDLVRAVNAAKDTEMSLAIIRGGEDLQVKVTPEERDEEEIRRIRRGFANRIGSRGLSLGVGPEFERARAEMERALKNMQQFGPLNNGWRRINPGIMLDREPQQFNFNVQVERDGDGPTKIKVQRGDESWEVTEDDLDKLPDDIRPMVENMLNGNRFNIQGLIAPRFDSLPPVPGLPPNQNNSRRKKQLEDRFEGLELKMQEIQDAIRSIQEDN